METRYPSSTSRAESPRPSTQRQRSNSFPIVEALGCSTPEAQLILAEGRAAVRKRRARERRNRSFDDEDTITYHPRDHLKYLTGEAANDWAAGMPYPPADVRRSHARVSSNATDRSTTSTIVALPHDPEPAKVASPTTPLGNYSAHLAQFIKAQLKSIPTYQPEHDLVAILSPRSCPEFSFPLRTPPLSPVRTARPTEPPRTIAIPPVRPPMRSAFSAWSSADDEEDDDDNDEATSKYDPLPAAGSAKSKSSNYTPSILGFYEAANNNSFLFSCTPLEDEEEEPKTAKRSSFGFQSALPGSVESQDNNDYPSSCLSRPQLTSSSAPSYSSSSASASSYFECKKRPLAITPGMRNRVIAALTPPAAHTKTVMAISPWEGNAITNVHDVHVESNQRIRVDGMSFDMLRDFVVPSRLSTPC